MLRSSQLTLSTSSTTSQLSIADAFLAPLTSDRPDGLFPTVVSSYAQSGHTLGLVYSSRESIAESIATGKGVYQSRKHGLWRKGETSGALVSPSPNGSWPARFELPVATRYFLLDTPMPLECSPTLYFFLLYHASIHRATQFFETPVFCNAAV